jgi:hypothetical protein
METQKRVNYHVLNNSIVVNFDGKTISVNKGDGRYKDVLACIKEGRLQDIPAAIDVGSYFENRGMKLENGLLHIDGEALPSALSQRVLQFRDEGLPFEPLLKFWENLKKNPSFNSRNMLYAFLEHNGHPLTDDGCFIAYRGVTEDFRDVHTKKFDNRVGQTCEMPRDKVDDNPNNTCSHGLHVACYDYAKGFGPQLIEVKVNPADVVAVPTDYNGTKMRVCKFEVVAVGEKLRTEPLYGQSQDEYNDDSYEDDNYDDDSYDDSDEDNGWD